MLGFPGANNLLAPQDISYHTSPKHMLKILRVLSANSMELAEAHHIHVRLHYQHGLSEIEPRLL